MNHTEQDPVMRVGRYLVGRPSLGRNRRSEEEFISTVIMVVLSGHVVGTGVQLLDDLARSRWNENPSKCTHVRIKHVGH